MRDLVTDEKLRKKFIRNCAYHVQEFVLLTFICCICLTNYHLQESCLLSHIRIHNKSVLEWEISIGLRFKVRLECIFISRLSSFP